MGRCPEIVKCMKCRKEMYFRPLSEKQIVLLCPDKSCGFVSPPIDIVPGSFVPLSKMIENYKAVLKKKGRVKELAIYCVDFSSRMDLEIPTDSLFLEGVLQDLAGRSDLEPDIRDALASVLNPPITYIKAVIFSLGFIIIDALKQMEVGDFPGFQVVSMVNRSEEVFRFPDFKDHTMPRLISEFLNALLIKMQEYRTTGEAIYRDFPKAIETVKELATEIRQTMGNAGIQIYFMIAGNNKTQTNELVNLNRLIMSKLNDLQPFKFNIIDVNPTAMNDAANERFKQTATLFNGFFSREPTFKGIFNTLVYNKLGTEPYVQAVKIKSPAPGQGPALEAPFVEPVAPKISSRYFKPEDIPMPINPASTGPLQDKAPSLGSEDPDAIPGMVASSAPIAPKPTPGYYKAEDFYASQDVEPLSEGSLSKPESQTTRAPIQTKMASVDDYLKTKEAERKAIPAGTKPISVKRSADDILDRLIKEE
jgi:hypothetical protein